MGIIQEMCGLLALLYVFIETRTYFQAQRSDDLSNSLAIRRIEWSKRDSSGHLPAGVGCVLGTICPWKVCTVLRPYCGQSLTTQEKEEKSRGADISAVIRYAVAVVYTNFVISIIDSEGFDYHGK